MDIGARIEKWSASQLRQDEERAYDSRNSSFILGKKRNEWRDFSSSLLLVALDLAAPPCRLNISRNGTKLEETVQISIVKSFRKEFDAFSNNTSRPDLHCLQ